MSIGVVVFVVWIALQGRLTVANVVGGLIVAVGWWCSSRRPAVRRTG
ncbi:MAG: hypothetical protein R2713_21025 [Ilumatobacteraceae bacterium]